MADNAQNRHEPSIEQLAAMLKSLHDPSDMDHIPEIPGLDAYAPSYSSGGTDGTQMHGQLERTSR